LCPKKTIKAFRPVATHREIYFLTEDITHIWNSQYLGNKSNSLIIIDMTRAPNGMCTIFEGKWLLVSIHRILLEYPAHLTFQYITSYFLSA
jgi:hypothetical protein